VFIIGGNEVVNSERTVTVLDNFNELDLFDEFGLGPAPGFVCRQGNMVVRSRAGERKTISELAGNDAPVFFLIPRKIGSDNIISILSFGNCGDPAEQEKQNKQFHAQFYSKTAGIRFSVQKKGSFLKMSGLVHKGSGCGAQRLRLW
jgi:hypothetical protein